MVINHNIAALNTYRQLSTNSANTAKSLEKLSSGLRINKAGDDAAGLAISEKMRSQISGLDQASRNAQDGISMVQTAEGGLNEDHAILQRMRELADQSANGTNTSDDRKAIQDEVNQLTAKVDRIGNTTEFNTQKLLNGSLKSAGGAAVGQNTTTGAVVAQLTAGKDVGSASIETNKPADATTDFVKETLKVDGSDIDVNWQDLSSDQKAVLQNVSTDATSRDAATKLVVNTINSAIDASGKSVAHVSGYIDSGTGALVIQSGSQGTNSAVTEGTAGIANKLMGGGTATAGANNYNGTAIDIHDVDLKIGSALMKVTLPTEANANTMDQVATDLEASIKSAVDTYNGATGKVAGEDGFIQAVSVKATNDGRLQLTSETGPVQMADRAGNSDVANLGLSQAQTDGGGNGGMTFQIGANKGQTITFGINDMRSAALGIAGLDVSSASGAADAITKLDTSIQSVSSERAKLGAVQNRLEHTINNLGTSSENLTAAESRVRDVDMASEMMNFTKNNILSQAAQSMLAQANQQPQGVLQLLR